MKKIYLIVVLCFLFIGITFFRWSFGKETVEVFYQGNRLMVSIDGNSSDRLPTSGNYYLASYYCNNKNTVVSWDRDRYELIVSNGNKKAGVSCYLNFETNPKLADMEAGSYVRYEGNYGCVGDTCVGRNINYVDSSHKGYCNSSDQQYANEGFRIAYSKDGVAYLVSAGAVLCGCTNGDGTGSYSCSSSLDVSSFASHIDSLNQMALKYCNPQFVYDGVCDSSTVRNINQDDFNYIINKGFQIGSCYEIQNKKCGYTNDLVDIGGDYWFGSASDSLSNQAFYWASLESVIRSSTSAFSYGVRPVIKMDSNVVVIGGNGTYEDPYVISNQGLIVKDVDSEKREVTLNMFANGASQMCVNVDSTVCTQYVSFSDTYLLNVSGLEQGAHVIYAYYKDKNGKVIATVHRKFSLM